jgi:hypothetical protein
MAKRAKKVTKKASLKKLVKKAVKKAAPKKAGEFVRVPSYAGSNAPYVESNKFPGFRLRKATDTIVRIHLSKALEPNLRYRENYIALDVPKSVLKGIVSKL